MNTNSITMAEQVDYLSEDPAIRGQNYVCLSFISPVDVVKRKEAYLFERFVESVSKDLNTLLDGLVERYEADRGTLLTLKDRYQHVFNPDSVNEEYTRFLAANPDLETEYLEKNNYQTSIYGLKVRGTFETRKEADIRCEVLRRRDPHHNIFIGQVGVWCPWAPNPEHIQDQEYANTELNTMMKKYLDNLENKAQVFEARKQTLLDQAKKAAANLPALDTADPWDSSTRPDGSLAETETEASASSESKEQA